MPNYCYHQMYCYGTAEDIEQLKQHILVKDEQGETHFDFNRIIPMPPELDIDCVSPVGSALKAIYALNKQRYGYETWYDWRIAYWGTKWNALNTVILDSPADLCIAFDTAWNPALLIYRQLCKAFPQVKFKIDYIEVGVSLAGSCEGINGELEEDVFDGDINEFAWSHFGWDLVNDPFDHDEGYDDEGNELPAENEEYIR